MHLQSQNANGQAGLLIGRDQLLRLNAPPMPQSPISLDDYSRASRELPQSPSVLLMNRVTWFVTVSCSSQQSLTKLSTVHALRAECGEGGPTQWVLRSPGRASGGTRTSIWRVRNQTLSPVREKWQNLFPLKFISRSETFEFREPYRMDGVQSFGEKRDFRRTIGRLCRSGVRSSNEKSLLLLGLICPRVHPENMQPWASWRREWDSNPRYGFPHTRFPSVRLKPLGHLSGWPVLKGPGDFCKGLRPRPPTFPQPIE